MTLRDDLRASLLLTDLNRLAGGIQAAITIAGGMAERDPGCGDLDFAVDDLRKALAHVNDRIRRLDPALTVEEA